MIDHVATVLQQWRQERPDLDPAPLGIVGRLHRVAGRLTEELVALYAAHGLGEGEFDILATLRRQGAPYALTAGELATQTMVTTGAITKRVDRCLARGWVTRAPSSADARGRVISLTETGRELIDAAFTEHLANEERLLAPFDAADRERLATLLTRWAEELGL